jgi:hypothetical protein
MVVVDRPAESVAVKWMARYERVVVYSKKSSGGGAGSISMLLPEVGSRKGW